MRGVGVGSVSRVRSRWEKGVGSGKRPCPVDVGHVAEGVGSGMCPVAMRVHLGSWSAAGLRWAVVLSSTVPVAVVGRQRRTARCPPSHNVLSVMATTQAAAVGRPCRQTPSITVFPLLGRNIIVMPNRNLQTPFPGQAQPSSPPHPAPAPCPQGRHPLRAAAGGLPHSPRAGPLAADAVRRGGGGAGAAGAAGPGAGAAAGGAAVGRAWGCGSVGVPCWGL